MTATEQQYQAGLLRQRVRAQQLQEAEELSRQQEEGESATSSTADSHLPTIEIGLWLLPAGALDFFEWIGQLVAVIPFIGWALAGASTVVGVVTSGLMLCAIAFWLIMRGVTPLSTNGMRIFIVLVSVTFGNAILNFLPAWTGFFLWLFIRSYKQALSPSIIKKKA